MQAVPQLHHMSQPPPHPAASTARRPRPPSLLPTSPPPSHALPAPPTMSPASKQQVSSALGAAPSLRMQHSAYSQSHTSNLPPLAAHSQHPYSAHPYASPQDDQPGADNVFASSYRQPPAASRPLQPLRTARSPPLVPPKAGYQPVGLGISPQSSSADQLTEQPSEASPRTPGRVPPPGSYFAVYPPAARDRSDSSTSAVSSASSSAAIPQNHRPQPPSVPPLSLNTSVRALNSSTSGPEHAPKSSQGSSAQHAASTSLHPGRSQGQRPSSRRALTAALELAKAAVQLDATNDDPHGAVLAYAKSVQLLGEVMERVMRGEDASGHGHAGSADGDERRKGGRRRSVVAKEEEVRRLKAIVSLHLL